jgi:hypothetical protein
MNTIDKANKQFIFAFLILQIDELNHRNQDHLNHHLLVEVMVLDDHVN